MSKTKDESWREEWIGMPEFVQAKVRPFSKIIVRFDSQEALDEFSQLIGQKLTPKTKSIWHPKLERGKTTGNKYRDENEY